MATKRSSRLSLAPLTLEEALAAALKVDPKKLPKPTKRKPRKK